MKTGRICLFACGAVLIVVMGLQAGFRLQESPQPRVMHLKTVVPDKMAGWVVRDEPLGATEAVTVISVQTLRHDDCVFRSYSRGGVRFEVYAAYWGPGKMPTRAVASHTPDRCWTENGMRCLEMKFKQVALWEGQATPALEWRLFEAAAGAKIHVVYWHLVKGALYDYGGRFNAMPNPWRWWTDVVSQAVMGSKEQFFVRVSSEQAFAELAKEDVFCRVMATLGKLGSEHSAP